MAKTGEKLSTETKMQISQFKKGQVPWNKGNGGICSADGCIAKDQAKGYCDYHYRRFRKGISFDKLKHGEMKKQKCIVDNCKKNAIAEFYCEQHYNILRNARRSKKVIQILGGKCDSCGEIFNPKLKRSNLEIHHLYYDKMDLEQIKKGRHRTNCQVHMEILRIVKNRKNPKEKFILFCHQCHMIETYAHQNWEKTEAMFSWLITNK